MTIEELLERDDLLEVGRLAVEKTLIDFRDNRLSVLGRGNGLVIREEDGTESSIICLGPEEAVRIALRAIFEEVNRDE